MASTPKTMSSRLAGMKFMQRSSKQSPSTTPNTPDPSTPDSRPAKRVRLSNGASAASTPSGPDPEALRAEEAIRRLGEERGETRWVLSVREPARAVVDGGMQIAYAGFAELDREGSEDEDEEELSGRMSFGGGVPKSKGKSKANVQAAGTAANGAGSAASVQRRQQDSASEQDSEDESGSGSDDSSDYDSDDPTAALIRETKRDVYAQERESRREHKSLQQAKASLASTSTPRAKAVHEDDELVGLMSLSGDRPSASRMRDVECFGCGKKGHVRSQCPSSGGSSRGGGRRSGGRGGRGGWGRR